jgi:hypothetical protein
MAGVPPVGLVIEGKAQMYNRKLGLENSDIVCDMPLPINKWPHPVRLVIITETIELTTFPIEIYTDGSKEGEGAAIYSNKQLIKQCKYKLHSNCSNNQAEQIAILKALEQLQGLEASTGGLSGYIHGQ